MSDMVPCMVCVFPAPVYVKAGYLSVRKQRAIVALQNLVDGRHNYRIEQLLLGRCLIKYLVKRVRLVVVVAVDDNL